MLKIRLARLGKKKQPTYRFVVSDSQKDLYGRQLEILGNYNPFSKVCDVKKDRILYWVSKGAQCSPTVFNLFVDQNVLTGKKVKATNVSKKKKAKAEEEAKSAKAATEAAPAPAAPEQPAAEETPIAAEAAVETPADVSAETVVKAEAPVAEEVKKEEPAA